MPEYRHVLTHGPNRQIPDIHNSHDILPTDSKMDPRKRTGGDGLVTDAALNSVDITCEDEGIAGAEVKLKIILALLDAYIADR